MAKSDWFMEPKTSVITHIRQHDVRTIDTIATKISKLRYLNNSIKIKTEKKLTTDQRSQSGLAVFQKC